MAYKDVTPPPGAKITIQNGKLGVPDNPILPFIRGDGTGPDIWAASERVFDAAVQKAYGGKRKVAWFEVFAGETAFKKFSNWLPDDTVEKFLERLDRVVRQPVAEFLERRFAGEHFEPGDLAFAAVGLLHSRIEHALAGGPDVRSRAVAADERENRVVRNAKFAVLNSDFGTGRRSDIFIGHGLILGLRFAIYDLKNF